MQAFFEISGLNIYLQLIVTIISISVHLFATRNKERKESVLEVVTIYTLGLSGWFGIMSGLFGHIIYADEVARGIGWPLNSGFQMELGFASIGIGMIGFLGFWSKPFWLPFILAKTTFLWGAALTHILHMIEHNNFSPSNTGIVLYWDILSPIILIALYILYQREKR
ncbi:MAG: hypothetical protein HN855_14745 [Anaerolineae bacterium]|jgi:hypothetical protein|nr:hypothetical protein [Anaerolineae bacterium]MBT7070866.1 hypothetical protein [Anaerolineae bacterium]MBT7326414.1 hypothetical protein [Anaerolineae bacterium]